LLRETVCLAYKLTAEIFFSTTFIKNYIEDLQTNKDNQTGFRFTNYKLKIA